MTNTLTAFDVSYRSPLDDNLTTFVDGAKSKGLALTVTIDEPAAEVARQVRDTGAEVIGVMDGHELRGYIFPNWISTQVTLRANVKVHSLTDAVLVLAKDPMLGVREHFHEWLNLERPTERQCPGRPPDGPHQTLGTVPCWKHR